MSIQDHFVPTKGFTFAEFDFAQLEIRVLALASMDSQLIFDITNGQDMHTYFASKIFNKPEQEIETKERKIAKGFSFQLQYGSSAKGIARFWDVEEDLAKTFIEEYYTRYPGIYDWQEGVLKEATASMEHLTDRNKAGELVPSYYIPSIWKDASGYPLSKYGVLGHISKYTGEAYVPPTKVKNYPIQAAAADIMAFQLVKLHEKYKNTAADVYLCNTVHDSVLVELRDLEFIEPIKGLLESVPQTLQQLFDIKSPVLFPVDVSTGETLQEVKNH